MRAAALVLAASLVAAAAPVPKETAEQKLARVFGTPVDPNKDCTFDFDGNKLTIKAGKGDHALHVAQMRMAAPRTLKEVEGDFVAEVKASAEHPTAAKPALASRNFLFHSQGLLLWADDKNYIRFEQARMDALDGTVTNYVSYELFKGGEWSRAGSTQDGELDPAKPTRFRLARKGAAVTGAFSTDDGKTWTDLPALALDLKAKAQVGVVANHNTDTPFTATFEDFTVTPPKK